MNSTGKEIDVVVSRSIAPQGPSTTAPERDGALLNADFYLNRYVMRPRVRS